MLPKNKQAHENKFKNEKKSFELLNNIRIAKYYP